MRKPLFALAVSAFGIGTSEFVIMGLLPDLAHSFRVSIPKTGILVCRWWRWRWRESIANEHCLS
jgi:predicted MFS family arabinose efflux permease